MPAGVKAEVRTYQVYVNGEWIDSRSAKTFPVYDPSTEEVIARVPDCNAEDVNRAVAAARAAFDHGGWPQTTAQERGRILFRLADKIRQNAAMLAELECRNCGKPIFEAEFDINDVATCFEYYRGLATKILGYVNPVPDNAMSLTLKEPIGVAGRIIPWNCPLLMAAWKLAPALAAGNTVVLKPAEQTPVTALELAKLIQEAGFPEGVVNIINGYGETAGAALASHKGIDKIAFTGSTEVGKLIAKAAAENLTRVSLELGGKAPNVIFADADLDQAVNGAMMGIFFNQGQVCCAGSRIFVEEKAKAEFLGRFKEKADRIKVGDPMDKATLMGPQVSEEQLNRIKGYVDIAREEGATVLTGGGSPQLDPQFQNGYFFQPTIFSDVDNNMRVAQEEIFGPVSSVITFKDDDELIQKANDTIYGLSAGIWTQNITRAHRFARAIKAGVVWINTYNMMNAASPFGGYKQSGYGREMGKHALELYTQVKSVWVDLSGKPIGWFGK